MTAQELLQLKNDIEKAKINIANLNGQKQTMLKQLKESFDCDNIEDAMLKLKDMDKEIDILNLNINTKLNEIDQKYNDNTRVKE